MKRLAFGALALLLTSGALIVGGSKPAYACIVNPDCDDDFCVSSCISRGYHTGVCSTCTGRCICS